MIIEHPVLPDFWAWVGVVLVALISGFISIAQRIVRGHEPSCLWVVSEFLAAIMAGIIAYDVYRIMEGRFPEWTTASMFVAVAAHFGGRSFQGIEALLRSRYGIYTDLSKKNHKK